MRHILFLFIFNMTISFCYSQVELSKSDQKIDVKIDGKLFTRYLYSDDQPKPVLVPVRTPAGIEVNRRNPLIKMQGGSDDHPHHVGLFFAVDQVNGTNFWKNSKTSPQIKHISIDSMKSGETGILSTTSQWINENGQPLLQEKRTMKFLTGKDENHIDIKIGLTALEEKVVFVDIEEGMFAIRLADALRESGSKVIPPPGQSLPKESVKGTGTYFSSNGDVTAGKAWGKRARWVALQGIKQDRIVGVAMMNHPESINYPSYWHVRGYGLFSANPLGQGDFQRQSKFKKNPVIPLNLTLQPGESVFFRFLVIVYDGRRTPEQLESRFREFVEK